MKASDGSEVEGTDPTPVVVLDDPVLHMRYRRLLAAGAEFQVAVDVSFRRDIDLHRAEDLVRRAGSALAAEILL